MSAEISERSVANAVVRSLYPYRRWLAVPNVSWGWLDYEADLIVVSDANWAQEIEIKISAQDLRNDAHKLKHRNPGGIGYGSISKHVQRFWYAVPKSLAEIAMTPGVIVEGAGLIAVDFEDRLGPTADVVKEAQKRRGAVKIEEKDRLQLLRLLGCRYWTQRGLA